MGVKQALPPPDPEEAAYKAHVAAQQEQGRQTRAAYAQRLSPFAGRLLLVTDFGSDIAPAYQAAHATRLAETIQSEVFSAETPLGLSVHLTYGRLEEGQQRQHQAAALLADSLRDTGFGQVLPAQPYQDTRDFWLRTVTQAAENTAGLYYTEPDQIGHIAIVFAMDAPLAGIRPAYTDGEAFLLTSATDTPEFSWQPIPRGDSTAT